MKLINNYLFITNSLVRSIIKQFIRIHTNRNIAKPRFTMKATCYMYYSTFSKVTDPYILMLLSFISAISICWSRYKSRQFKNLLNPIFILSSILGSELNFAINVCISINKNSKHFAVNLNIIGVFADD